MFGFFIWWSLMMGGTSREGRLLPTPPKHLMMERPERPTKSKKKKKKRNNYGKHE